MIACEKCFRSPAWIAAVAGQTAAPGTCEFGHGYSARTWPTSIWSDYFIRLVETYTETTSTHGAPLWSRIQTDWKVFDLGDELSRRFLESALEGENIDVDGVVVMEFESSGPGANHTLSWTEFVREVTEENRFFPQRSLDYSILQNAMSTSETTIRAGTPLFRVRSTPSESSFPIEEMGAPPAKLAAAGRANPAGIAYLYLSFDDITAVHEARIPNQGYLSVATFDASKDLRVLNLADIEHPHPFGSEDLKQRLSYFDYLSELALELSRPIGDSEREIDYVPTQYLCELAKISGMDGVMYSSSLYPSGRNLVLFSSSSAVGRADVKLAQVTAVQSTWAYC